MDTYKKILVLLILTIALTYGLQLSRFGFAWQTGGPGGECYP